MAITTLAELFARPASAHTCNDWLFLPPAEGEHGWSVDTVAIVMPSEEVAPDQEDVPDAGTPAIVIERGYRSIVPWQTLQGIIDRPRSFCRQRNLSQPLAAVLIDHLYYDYKFDAYLED